MDEVNQNSTDDSKVEMINKIYDYTKKLISEENKNKEEVVTALLEMGIDKQKASAIYSDVIYQINLSEVRNETNQGKRIKGWLAFFVISMCLGVILSLVNGFSTFSFGNYEELGDISQYIGAFCELFFYVLFGILGVYATISFVKIKPNAVFLGKSYIVVLFFNNLVLLLAGDYESSYIGSLQQLSRSLVFCGIWFSYLCLSAQVKNLFPSDKRVKLKRDKLLVALMIINFVVLFLSVFIESFAES